MNPKATDATKRLTLVGGPWEHLGWMHDAGPVQTPVPNAGGQYRRKGDRYIWHRMGMPATRRLIIRNRANRARRLVGM